MATDEEEEQQEEGQVVYLLSEKIYFSLYDSKATITKKVAEEEEQTEARG